MECEKAFTNYFNYYSVRAGNSELHTIAAFMGGVVSQEIIKLITKQYVPLKGMMIFNGMRSSCGVYGFTPSP